MKFINYFIYLFNGQENQV